MAMPNRSIGSFTAVGLTIVLACICALLFDSNFALADNSPVKGPDQQAEKNRPKDIRILTVLRMKRDGSGCVVYVGQPDECVPVQKVEQVKQPR